MVWLTLENQWDHFCRYKVREMNDQKLFLEKSMIISTFWPNSAGNHSAWLRPVVHLKILPRPKCRPCCWFLGAESSLLIPQTLFCWFSLKRLDLFWVIWSHVRFLEGFFLVLFFVFFSPFFRLVASENCGRFRLNNWQNYPCPGVVFSHSRRQRCLILNPIKIGHPILIGYFPLSIHFLFGLLFFEGFAQFVLTWGRLFLLFGLFHDLVDISFAFGRFFFLDGGLLGP